MKRLFALLLIGALLLSGCAIKDDDSAKVDQLVEEQQPEEEKIPTMGGEQETPAPQKEQSKEGKESADSDAPPKEKDKGTAPSDKEPTLGDAVKLAQKRGSTGGFGKSMTAAERSALQLYLIHENYLYLSAQEQGLIGNYSYVSGEVLIDLDLYTTEKAIGTNLLKENPLDLSKEEVKQVSADKKVRDFSTVKETVYHPRILQKEISAPKDYLQNVDFPSVVPQGKVHLRLKFSKDAPISKETVEKIIRHYFSVPGVLWIELAHSERVEKDADPCKIHEFWKDTRPLSMEQASAIAREKALKRLDEKLSIRERKAFYLLSNTFAANQKWRFYPDSVRIATTKAGLSLNPLRDFPSGWENTLHSKGASLVSDHSSVRDATKALENKLFFVTLFSSEGEAKDILTISPVGNFEIDIAYKIHPEKGDDCPVDMKKLSSDLLRHYWSVDCVTWVELDHQDRWPHLVEIKAK